MRCLIGKRGFLLFDPLLLIALYYAIARVVKREVLWPEALLVLATSCCFAGYFILYSSNYGGWCYSVRWFVTLLPLLWFFAFPFFAEWTTRKTWIYGTLFAAGFAIAMLGAVDQWPPAPMNPATPAFVLNWRELVHKVNYKFSHHS